MVTDLFIRNYKNIKSLTVSDLGDVNLFTGRNNTGKSTLLEAIAILVQKGDVGILADILIDRGEFDGRTFRRRDDYDIMQTIEMIGSLFTNRVIEEDYSKEIYIGTTDENGNYENTSVKTIRFKIVRYYEESIENDVGELTRKRTVVESNDTNNYSTSLGFQIVVGDAKIIISLEDGTFERILSRTSISGNSFQYVKSTSLSVRKNGVLWDKITLTDKEKYVIRALKIIEPTIERVAFVGGDRPDERIVVARLEESGNVVPLRSMGDGINRILSIILAAVNAENGTLLIDEFENGLHYTVQEPLWNIVFELSRQLNIQVFATTHSSDCIEGYENNLNQFGDVSGKLIRLEKFKEGIRTINFDRNELRVATDQDIETR